MSTVPAEAQQALLFLAPETGGDFNTLRKAVHDKARSVYPRGAGFASGESGPDARGSLSGPGQSHFADRSESLKENTELAARSLGLKINQDCFDKPAEVQVSCLSQNSAGLVLDDSNVQSVVAQLTNGSTTDLMNQLSYSSMAGGGAYSPYIGAIVDTARILSSLHTAHFQYIPALALPAADTLNLRLNTPPSFRDPKSVVVVALPPLGPAIPEPLHPVVAAENFCGQKPGLVLPAEGAPMVFASRLAHDLFLRIEAKGASKSSPIELPLAVDSAKGGLVLQQAAPPLPAGDLVAVVHGKWGFDPWTGPQFRLVSSEPGGWTLAAADQSALVVGREDTLHFEGRNSLCVDHVEEHAAGATPAKLLWKSPAPEKLDVAVPMKDAAPGPVTISIYQYGIEKPEEISMTAFADAASIDRITISAGDSVAMLKGTRLDEVAAADLDGIAFLPSTLSRVEDHDQLLLKASAPTSRLDPRALRRSCGAEGWAQTKAPSW